MTTDTVTLRPVGRVVGGRSADLDALSGAPVLDVKPYLIEFAPRHPVTQPAWASELMSSYY
ncbi:hypothetical protein [Herbidospora yilanensis]|uniref:hypothetical protein n=1 Tax=Herbidospora yilanensis TaxID=354426 RepID=UPI00078195EE|nr:hypothetical protein [Herbidospora yilanensis]